MLRLERIRQRSSIADSFGAAEQWYIQNTYSSTANNGNVTAQMVRRFGTTTWNESYTYTDGLNRLNAASESGNWTQTGATHNGGSNQTAINGVLTGIQYDAENRMVQVTSAGSASTYSYDGEGRRVQRVSGGVTSPSPKDTTRRKRLSFLS